MPDNFFDRLQDYYANVAEVLRGEAKSSSIFPNNPDAGQNRERFYAELLRQHLPSTCNVFLGGFLFDLAGRVSKQIDIVVTNGQSPRFNLNNPDGQGKSFACIDGTLAVVSVKSHLNTKELCDCLDNLASLPDKKDLGDRANPLLSIEKAYCEWPYKVILSYDGMRTDNVVKAMNEYYASNPDIPLNKRPNVIYVVGQYLIIRIGEEGGETRDGTVLKPHSYHAQSHQPDAFSLPYIVSAIQKISIASTHVLFSYDELYNQLPLA